MISRGIDVEYSYRWSSLQNSLLSSEVQIPNPPNTVANKTSGCISPPIEALAGKIRFSETTGIWTCLVCGKDKSKNGLPFKSEIDIAKHHTHCHCIIRNTSWFHCPYCQKRAKLFCSIKSHLTHDECHVVRSHELDHGTWDDIIRVNLMISKFEPAKLPSSKPHYSLSLISYLSITAG